MSETAKIPNAKRLYEVTRAELPIHCPTPEMSRWNSHPRVFLPLGEESASGEVTEARCPYCGAVYRLKD